MSATLVDSALPRGEKSRQWPTPTADLDSPSTTDVHEENTADLATQEFSSDSHNSSGTERRKSTAPVRPSAIPASAGTPARAPAAMTPGAILCDRYILEQAIGQGGTAIVYRARDIQGGGKNKAQIAIKAPRPTVSDEARATRRLKHEFERAKVLSHPNIVRVYDLHRAERAAGETWFMTMELIEGKLLSTLLKERTSTPVSLAHKILRACGSALSYAHSQQVVHGDFKPGNIFVTPDANVKIVDFGAAAASPEDPSRIPAATPAYASPEVLSGQTPESRDDVFSFGCVAYELLTGQHPFDHQSSLQARDTGCVPQRAWNLSAPQWLALLSALSWQREQRPASIESLMIKLTSDYSDIVVPEMCSLDAPQLDNPITELPAEIMPPNRSWGFIAFAAALLGVLVLASQRDNEVPSSPPAVNLPKLAPPATESSLAARPAPTRPLEEEVLTSPSSEASAPIDPPAVEDEEEPISEAVAIRAKPSVAARTSHISFETGSIVTSETSIAAVLVTKRSAPLNRRAVVHWEAISDSAEIEGDFLVPTGSIEFAEGQATRAIYIPLRNDQVKEEDETFTVVLRSPSGAKLGTEVHATATIRDDD